MNPDDLTMIPIYCGVEGEEKAGLCCGTENCWAINKNASGRHPGHSGLHVLGRHL